MQISVTGFSYQQVLFLSFFFLKSVCGWDRLCWAFPKSPVRLGHLHYLHLPFFSSSLSTTMYKKIFFYSLKQNILLKQTQTNTNSFADFLALIQEHLSLF